METAKMTPMKKFLIFVPCFFLVCILGCLLSLKLIPSLTIEKVLTVRQIISMAIGTSFWGWLLFLRKRESNDNK